MNKYVTKLDNVDEMEKSLKRQKLLKLIQKETDHMNKTIMNVEIKLVKTNKTIHKKKLRLIWLQCQILLNI